MDTQQEIETYIDIIMILTHGMYEELSNYDEERVKTIAISPFGILGINYANILHYYLKNMGLYDDLNFSVKYQIFKALLDNNVFINNNNSSERFDILNKAKNFIERIIKKEIDIIIDEELTNENKVNEHYGKIINDIFEYLQIYDIINNESKRKTKYRDEYTDNID